MAISEVIRSLLTQDVHAPCDGAAGGGGAREAVFNRQGERGRETGECPFPRLAQGPSMEASTIRNLPE